jgi:hypothetical protein
VSLTETEESIRNDSQRVGAKRNLWVGSERHFISGERKSILFLEGSQAMPALPSVKDGMRMKMLW